MIYLRLSKDDEARLTRASERLGKSKAAFARDAIEVELPILEQQAAEIIDCIPLDNDIQNS